MNYIKWVLFSTGFCLAFLVAPSIFATTGLSSLSILVVIYIFLCTFLVLFLTFVAKKIVKYKQTKTIWSNLIIILASIAVVYMAFLYLIIYSAKGAGLGEVIYSSISTFLSLIYFLSYFIKRPIFKNKFILLLCVLYFIALAAHPSVINFKYFTYVDNSVLENKTDIISQLGPFHITTQSGKLLNFNKRIHLNNLGANLDAELVAISKDNYRVIIEVQKIAPIQKFRYQGNKKSLFKIPLIEVKIDTNKAVDYGVATIVNEYDAKIIRLKYKK